MSQEVTRSSSSDASVASAAYYDKAKYSAVVKLLGRSNYEAWLSSITEYCRSHGLSGYLDGSTKEPKFDGRSRKGTREERLEAFGRVYTIWNDGQREMERLIDNTTYGWCSEERAIAITMIHPAWDKLRFIKGMWGIPSNGNRTFAMNAFLNLEATGTVMAFLDELDACFENLAHYGVEMPDNIRVPYVLAKLGRNRPQLMSHIDSAKIAEGKEKNNLSYQDVVRLCLKYEGASLSSDASNSGR